MKKRLLSILLALAMLAALLPVGLVDTAQAAESGVQVLTPASGTSGTGANGGTWKCSSAGDTLTLSNYDGYPIETDATTIELVGTNTITVPRAGLSSASSVCGLRLTSTRETVVNIRDAGSSLNIVYEDSSAACETTACGIEAAGPLLIGSNGTININIPYGYPYGIRARQGLDYSGSGVLDITVKGSYLTSSGHWCAAYGIAVEKGAVSLSGAGTKTIRVLSRYTFPQISSMPYGIYHKGGVSSSSGTATVSVYKGALHILMSGYGYGIYNGGDADSAYVNINDVPELSIDNANSAIKTDAAANINVRRSKLSVTNGQYAIQAAGGTITLENAKAEVSVSGSSAGYTDAAVRAGTLTVKGDSTVDLTAKYGTAIYAGNVSVSLSGGSFTARTMQANWPPIKAPVMLGANTRLVTGALDDTDDDTYTGAQEDGYYVTRFTHVRSGSCGDSIKWTLTGDGTLTISGTGAMADYAQGDAPWYSVRSQIKTVVIENGVTSVGDRAFCDCTALTSVTIPASVTSIGRQAFLQSGSLARMDIPASVTSIGNGAFYDCNALMHVYYGGYGMEWTAAGGDDSGLSSETTVHYKEDLYGKGSCGEDLTWTLTPAGTLTISGTGSIGNYEYSYETSRTSAPWDAARTHIRSVVIEDGVTGIGDYAFYECAGLTAVTLPEGVTGIGNRTFSGCTGLTGVTLPKGVTSIGDETFLGCTGLTSMTIPQGVTSIGRSAFYGCTGMTSVDIPNSVTCIETCSFYNCSSLTSVTIPDGVTRLGGEVFSGCTSLTSVTIPEGVDCIYGATFKDCTSLTSVKLPSTIDWVGESAFSNCVRLTSITIPKRVCYIYKDAFLSCGSLTDVYYDGTAADWAKITMEDGNEDLQRAALHAAPDAPATVTLGTAKAGASGIKVTWAKTEGAVKYNVYRRTADTKWTSTPLATVSGTSFTDKTVKAGETYIYTVRGVASDGKTLSAGYDKTGVTATALPATVTLGTAKAGANGITVTWKQAEGAVKYRVYRQAAGESSWTTLTSSATGTSYTDKKATAGVTYTYTVRGMNSANGLSAAYDKTGVTATALPATVTLGTAKAGANGIKVTWTQTEGAVKYNVYRRTADTKWTSAPLATVSGTSFTDKTVKAGETYIYTVRGIASDGKSLSTGYDKTGVTATALPATVKLGTAKASGSSIVVTWSKAEGAVKYRVYRQAAGESSWTTLTSSATGTSYTDKTAKAGVTYTYTVRALNSANGLSAGYDKNGVKAIIAPATVTLGTAKAGASGITVTWAKADGAVKYNVYRRTAETKWTSAPLATVDGTSYVDKTAKAGVKYIYTVRGVASDGKTLSAGYDKTGVSATALPATVKLTGAKVSGSSIVVTWSKAEGAVKYRVYRKSAGTDWTTLTSSATGTSFTDKTVKAGVKYTYTVRALNSVNGLSGGYDKNGVSAVIAPAKVVLVSARADSAGILVTWKAASGAHTYQVYRKTASDGWKLVAKNISDTEWKDTSAVKGTTYTYTVRAVADDGTTRGACDTRGKSATVTKASTTPANVTMGKATAGKKGITVTWSYAADAKTYNVYRQAAGEKTWTAVAKNVNGKSWTDTKVTKGTKYTYMVRGVSANGKVLSRSYTATVSATAK